MSLNKNITAQEQGSSDLNHWGKYTAREVWNFIYEFSEKDSETKEIMIEFWPELAQEALEWGRAFSPNQQKILLERHYYQFSRYFCLRQKLKNNQLQQGIEK